MRKEHSKRNIDRHYNMKVERILVSFDTIIAKQLLRLSIHYLLVLFGEFPLSDLIKCFRLCLKPVLSRDFKKSNAYFKRNFPRADTSLVPDKLIVLNLNLNTYYHQCPLPRERQYSSSFPCIFSSFVIRTLFSGSYSYCHIELTLFRQCR